jgi:hypothetical protein
VLKLVPLLALACGCEASLGADHSDAGGGGGGSDGSGSGSNQTDAAVSTPDAATACANGRKVYLNFDGVAITQAATSDSTTNKASWIGVTTANVPPWRNGSGTRAADIVTVTDGVKARLTGLPFDIVTTRPTAGPYVMIVFGGSSSTVGSNYSFSTSFHDCGDTVKNDVGWVSDMGGQGLSLVADIAVGSIGWSLGLDGTNDPADCMCGWANGCTSAAGACTLSANIGTIINNGLESPCKAGGNQDEVAAFSTGFCAP